MVTSRPRTRSIAPLFLAAIWSSFVPEACQPQSAATPQDAPRAEPGLSVLFATTNDTGRGATDLDVSPNVWLYVPTGQSPTPFLPAGGFTAVWNGSVAVDSRADFQFQAELSGQLKLEINGVTALDATSAGAGTAPGKSVRLKKGTNTITATFQSPARGDAFVRLFWLNKDTPRQPIPPSALTFVPSAIERRARQIHLGRDLFVEYRCAKCHTLSGTAAVMPELTMDAAAFDSIGSRREGAWMARWIADPQAQQPVALMPRLLHGPAAQADARAIAAFLVSLKAIGGPAAGPAAPPPTEEQILAGKQLFDSLHCVACHNAPDSPDTDAEKISLKHVREKFVDGALALFLLRPEANFAWIRMPRFTFTEAETARLAAYLNARADPPVRDAAPVDATLIPHGLRLVQTRGCLNCHTLKLDNPAAAPTLARLTPDKWDRGCLAASLDEGSPAPQFRFTAEAREALRAFGASDRASLTRQVPADFAERQTRRLRCRECHGKFDGFPALDNLGGKLKPEWSGKFIAGEIPYIPRPWLEARMPAFPRWANEIARGLAMQHGYPPQTPAEPPVDGDAAAVGRKLISAAGGFSCISCHAVGEMAAMQAADNPGPNLAHTGERLRRPYFERWVRNPQQTDPSTKMPVFFDEEDRSPLADIFGGDGAKQRNALWQYLRLGDKMPAPPTP